MRVLIITDSIGHARSFPESQITQVEETFPYLLRQHYPQATFWQLSYGNVTTEQLIGQVLSYVSVWPVDIIIVLSGINDCRPEAFSELQKMWISSMSGRFFSKIKQWIYAPSLIRWRQRYRVKPAQFKKTVQKLKMVFNSAHIFWLEIAALPSYERARPGVNARMKSYNDILKSVYPDTWIPVLEDINKVNGYNEDGLHWNKAGHRIVADKLIVEIQKHYQAKALT